MPGLRCAFLSVACALVAGCATTSPQAWMENGKRVGSIFKTTRAYGTEIRYVNTAGEPQRLEKRDPSGMLLPGASVTRFVYNPSGYLVEEVSCDGAGDLAPCEEGYAVKAYSYSKRAEGDRVVTWTFLDKDRKPIGTLSGYAVVRVVYAGATAKVREFFLEDVCNRPASATWDDVSGVARVKFTVLDGIGEIRCAIYYGPDGAVVRRKTVDGSCHYDRTTTTYQSRY
jgi:hypothetical protein